MGENDRIDCEQVKACLQVLIYEVDQLKEKEQNSQERINCIEKKWLQVKWIVVGILITMIAYAIGLVEVAKRLVL